MTYAGNDSLSPEIQRRVLDTFRQTLGMVEVGSRVEAGLGCDFILRLDPDFEPARVLKERLEAGGEIELSDLVAAVPPPVAPETTRPPEPPPTAPLASDRGAAAAEAPAAQEPAPAPPPALTATPEGEEEIAFSSSEVDQLFDELGEESGEPSEGELEIFPVAPPPGAKPVTSLELPGARVTDVAPPPREPAASPLPPPAAPASPGPEEPAPRAAEPPAAPTPSPPAPPPEAAPPPAASPREQPETPAPPGPEPAAGTPPPIAAEPAEPAEAPPPPMAAEPPEPAEAPPPPMAAEPPEPAEAPPPPNEPVAGPAATETPGKTDAQPEVALDSESAQRIHDLLAEGQAAFEGRHYQAAIDAWSRIFLIDIDHPEANRRIEQARKLKAEDERSVEEALHEGMTHLNNGDYQEARAIFERIVATQPNHTTALEYLEKLDRAAEMGAQALADIVPPPEMAAPEEESFEIERSEAEVPGADAEPRTAPREAVPPPRPVETPEPAPEEPLAAKPAPSRRRFFLAIGGAVLVAVLAAGGFLYSRWDSFFPNAVEPQVTEARPGPIERAQQLHAEGRTSMAIAQLRRLAPDSPHFAEAQALIEAWETAREGEQETAESLRMAEREALLERARSAHGDGDYVAAEALLTQAEAIAPLAGEAATLATENRRRIDPIREQLTMFEQGEWEMALRALWRQHTAEPENQLIRRLMADCYYNLGVRDLQRGDTLSASEQFGEALALRPGEPELVRLARFASTYQQRPQDLLYRIFVKYLPFR